MTNEHKRMPSKIALEPTPTPPGALEFEADCDLVAKDSNIVSRRYGTGIANSINLPRPTFVDDLRSPGNNHATVTGLKLIGTDSGADIRAPEPSWSQSQTPYLMPTNHNGLYLRAWQGVYFTAAWKERRPLGQRCYRIDLEKPANGRRGEALGEGLKICIRRLPLSRKSCMGRVAHHVVHAIHLVDIDPDIDASGFVNLPGLARITQERGDVSIERFPQIDLGEAPWSLGGYHLLHEIVFHLLSRGIGSGPALPLAPSIACRKGLIESGPAIPILKGDHVMEPTKGIKVHGHRSPKAAMNLCRRLGGGDHLRRLSWRRVPNSNPQGLRGRHGAAKDHRENKECFFHCSISLWISGE